MKYIARGINLDEEVWAALNKARQIHGSYNKFLRKVLTANGVFKRPKQPQPTAAKARRK